MHSASTAKGPRRPQSNDHFTIGCRASIAGTRLESACLKNIVRLHMDHRPGLDIELKPFGSPPNRCDVPTTSLTEKPK